MGGPRFSGLGETQKIETKIVSKHPKVLKAVFSSTNVFVHYTSAASIVLSTVLEAKMTTFTLVQLHDMWELVAFSASPAQLIQVVIDRQYIFLCIYANHNILQYKQLSLNLYYKTDGKQDMHQWNIRGDVVFKYWPLLLCKQTGCGSKPHFSISQAPQLAVEFEAKGYSYTISHITCPQDITSTKQLFQTLARQTGREQSFVCKYKPRNHDHSHGL